MIMLFCVLPDQGTCRGISIGGELCWKARRARSTSTVSEVEVVDDSPELRSEVYDPPISPEVYDVPEQAIFRDGAIVFG